MMKFILAAGVAALAITAPAASAPGDNRGKARAETQKVERAGKARAQRTETRAQRRDVRAGRVEARAQRPDVRASRVEARANRGETRRAGAERRFASVQERRADRADRPRELRMERVRDQRADRVREQRMDVRAPRIDTRARIAEQRLDVGDRRANRIEMRDGRRFKSAAVRDQAQLRALAQRDVIPLREWDDLVRGGVWLNGCPPGLAKKPVACMPPGQVKRLIGQPVSVLSSQVALQPLPVRLSALYPDTNDYYYRYGNGYMYQVNRSNDLVSSLLPLFGLGLLTGQPFPTAYSNYYLPAGLQPFYANSPYDCPRYANGYVYEVDCVTGVIEDVDPLLGYGYGYGQMMPLSYSAYNVPYQYRPLYFDTADSYYRYAPGAIYQVDPTTSLITAVAALLTGGLNVGQPLPMGYSAYNVPYQYRTTYYDTPDAWYRYSNGYVYQVDPRTMLVTAIVASALT